MTQPPTAAFKLKPLLTPNFVQVETPPRPKQDGVHSSPSLHVSQVSEEALNGLVSLWLTELYAKAGKQNAWALPNQEAQQ